MKLTVFRPRWLESEYADGGWLLGMDWYTNGGPECHYNDGRTLWYTYVGLYLGLITVMLLFNWTGPWGLAYRKGF